LAAEPGEPGGADFLLSRSSHQDDLLTFDPHHGEGPRAEGFEPSARFRLLKIEPAHPVAWLEKRTVAHRWDLILQMNV
jgi:hypothetical protein